MINKLLLVLLILLSGPNYSQDIIVKNHQQLSLLNSNLNSQPNYFEKNYLSNKTQKTNELNNGNLIWITDVGINCRINPLPQRTETGTYHDEVFNEIAYKEIYNRGRFYLTADVGVLKKINKNIGLGNSHFIGIDSGDDGLRNGIKLKYRQWLKNGSFFDISPGITLFDSAFMSPGFTGSMEWWKNEYFALTVLIEYLPPIPDTFGSWETDEGYVDTMTEEYEKDFGIYFGLKTGSKVGRKVICGVALLFVGGAVLFGLAGSG